MKPHADWLYDRSLGGGLGMSIGSVAAVGSPFMAGATQPQCGTQNDEVCECNGHLYFKKDEEFFAQAYGRELRWPITGQRV